MGAASFMTRGAGKTAAEAFRDLTAQARYESGHGGYSGTVGEKHSFVMIRDTAAQVLARDKAGEISSWWRKDLEGTDPEKQKSAIAGALMDLSDRRIDDKWGPAGCIELKPGLFLFFGWASE